MEQVNFRQIMSESNRSFLEILRSNDYDYTEAENHNIENDLVSEN